MPHPDMPKYRHAFPDFDYGLPELPQFEDMSNKNDTCPHLLSTELGLKLFCDYADPARREEGAEHRYTLYLANKDGDAIDAAGNETGATTGTALVATDDWDAVLAAIETHRNAMTAPRV